MPTNRKRVAFAPDHKALVALGLDPDLDGTVTSAAVSGALARYADLMYEAAADMDRLWRRTQWGFVADCLRNTRFPVFTPSDYPAHLAVIQAIDREHGERRIGDGWFLNAIDGAQLTLVAARQKSDARVKAVCEQLRALTPVHGAAVLAAVRWYWDHEEELKDTAREWWLPSDRNKEFNSRAKIAKPKPPPAPAPKKANGASLFDDADGEGDEEEENS